MHLTSAWVGLALCCLCASLAASAQDYPEDDEMILDLIREDGTQPETGAEPAAEFLKCNKVIISVRGFEVHLLQTANSIQPLRLPDKFEALISLLCRNIFYFKI